MQRLHSGSALSTGVGKEKKKGLNMILVVGGAYQGKEEYAANTFPEKYKMIKDYQEIIREQLKAGKEPLEEAKRLLAGKDREKPDESEKFVILCDEVGCGIVPMDAFERKWREQTGRVCCFLAERAEQVIRVQCGIGTVLRRKRQVFFFRHGATKGNREHRYVGSTDEALLPEGENALEALLESPAFGQVQGEAKQVYVSPLVRCRQTAELLFPELSQIAVPDLRECDFGAFEYKNYEELNGNPEYQKWIDSYGACGFPGGETKEEFTERCGKAFLQVVHSTEEERLLFVVHGGTIMALLDAFSSPHGDYYDWQVKNGEGFRGILVEEVGKKVRIEEITEMCAETILIRSWQKC